MHLTIGMALVVSGAAGMVDAKTGFLCMIIFGALAIGGMVH